MGVYQIPVNCSLRITIVFPTHVGVYLGVHNAQEEQVRFPHARGGVPAKAYKKTGNALVFPTHVGVYRQGVH